MTFASDLDGTLIYSPRIMGITPQQARKRYRAVDEYRGAPCSFTSEKVLRRLGIVRRRIPFIPVTTRSTEQYFRLTLFEEGGWPEWAVTCNGAVILHRGEPLGEWTGEIRRKIAHLSPALSEIRAYFTGGRHVFPIRAQRCVENYFCYFIMDGLSPADAEHLSFLSGELAKRGWLLSHQGRKVYVAPRFVDKGAALRFVLEKAGLSCAFAAGDSRLDQSLLACARFRLVSGGGEIAQMCRFEQDFYVTENSGVGAAEEILAYVGDKAGISFSEG